VGPRSDAVVTGLYLAAMASGADLRVEAPLSAGLVARLDRFGQELNSLFPRSMRRVHIEATDLPASTPARGVGASFSGGVDSFHTLHSHLRESEPDPLRRITHALFVQGLDIGLNDTFNFERCIQAYTPKLGSLDVQLIPVTTNIRSFYRGLDMSWMHISPLVGAAHFLGESLGVFYLPSGWTDDEHSPWGEVTALVKLLSSDRLDVVYDGATMTRADKLRIVAEWPVTYDVLRVCLARIDGVGNCCRCDKCLGTMVGLELAGALARYSSFPLPLTGAALRRVDVTFSHRLNFVTVIRAAVAARRFGLARDMSLGYALSVFRWTRTAVRRWRKEGLRVVLDAAR
jgi:hypothetical protein